MKNKVIQILLGLIISQSTLSAQGSDTVGILYDYELLTTGKTTINGDSVYNAVFKIDTNSIKSFKRLTVIGNEKEKAFSVTAKNIETDPNFALFGDAYIYDAGEWTGVISWSVKGQKHDETEVLLKNKKEEEGVKHKVLVEKKPRSLKRNFSNINPPEESPDEPEQ